MTALLVRDVVIACADREALDFVEFWPYGPGVRRSSRQVRARRLAALILRDQDFSYPQIAKALGYEDHTTVLNLMLKVTHEDRFDAMEIRLSLMGELERPRIEPAVT